MFSKPIRASGAALTVASLKMISTALIHTATVRLIFNGAVPVSTNLGLAGTVQYTSYIDSPAFPDGRALTGGFETVSESKPQRALHDARRTRRDYRSEQRVHLLPVRLESGCRV